MSAFSRYYTGTEFRDVERHIFRTDVAERADHPASQDRPEAFNRIGVNGTDNADLTEAGAPRAATAFVPMFVLSFPPM